MRSIKLGRGPSLLGGVMSLAIGLFGLIWTILVASMGGGLFALFGVLFMVVAVVQAIYHFSNATRRNRFSVMDITSGTEEPDPLNERFGGIDLEGESAAEPQTGKEPDTAGDSAFCPYCGNPVEKGFEFCNRCGKRLP